MEIDDIDQQLDVLVDELTLYPAGDPRVEDVKSQIRELLHASDAPAVSAVDLALPATGDELEV